VCAPVWAIAWEVWGARRRGFLTILAVIPVFALLYQGLSGPLHRSEGLRHLSYLPMGFSVLMVFVFFNFTEHNSRQRYAGFPYRLFTLPVATRLLVSCPMLCGVVTVVAVYVAWAELVFRPLGQELPVRWPATLLATGMACYQAVIWGLAGFRLTRLIVLSVTLSGLVAVGFVPDVLGTVGGRPLETILTCVLLASALAAYLTALSVVDRQRHGGIRGWVWWRARWRRVGDALPRRTSPFASPARAAAWIEWRRNGAVLPVCVALTMLLIVGPISWINGNGPATTIRTLAWIIVLPIGLAGFVGQGFSKPDFWSGDLALPSFVAMRPLASGDLVMAKLKVAAVATLLTWCIVLALTAAWLVCWCDTKYLEASWAFFRTLYAPPVRAAVVGLTLFAAMTLTWSLLLTGLPAGLSGRGRTFLVLAWARAGVILAVALGVIWVANEPSLVSRRLQDVLPWLPWALALAFVAKTWAAVWSFHDSHRLGLISTRTMIGYLGLWLAATCLLVSLPGLLFADIPWLQHLLGLLALSLVPLARVGRSVLALDRNRHRGPDASLRGHPARRFGRVPALSRTAVLLGLALPCASFLLAGEVVGELPRRFDAGGHRLRMLVAGRGSPTVILETSGMGPIECWAKVQPAVARFARVVSYDHAGYWGSEPGPRPRDARRIAQELHAALHDARINPPYVLVGYSFGGPIVRVFAGLYPEEVIGLVLVDPSQEAALEWLRDHHPEVNRITEQDVARQDEWGCSWASLDQARAARLSRDLPVTLITCTRHDGNKLMREVMPVWIDAHKNWLKGVPGARHVVTEKSGHGIVFEEPELVVEAVKEVIDRADLRATRHD
jgi:pimeloyl-ACP methyl ester carboxylesterase